MDEAVNFSGWRRAQAKMLDSKLRSASAHSAHGETRGRAVGSVKQAGTLGKEAADRPAERRRSSLWPQSPTAVGAGHLTQRHDPETALHTDGAVCPRGPPE